LPNERATPQTVVFDVQLYCNTRPAADSQNIQHTIDYATVADRIVAYAAAAQDYLVETLAQNICAQILEDSRIKAVRLRVSKPEALVNANAVGVEIYRER